MTTNCVPIVVLTGFLGAGKTTALNSALTDKSLARSAVIINEFGETGLDHLFVPATSDAIVELANGCVCCTIRGQLIDTLIDLPTGRFDRVIIETTGLADPVSILQAVSSDQIASRYTYRGMVCMIDALNGLDQLSRYNEAARQTALAGHLFLTKLDLIPAEQRAEAQDELTRAIANLNPRAAVEPVSTPAMAAALAGGSAANAHPYTEIPQPDALADIQPVGISAHAANIRTITLHHDRPLPAKAIEMFCELLTSAHGAHLLRLKGIVAVQEDARPLVVHCVGGIMHEPQWLDCWPTGLEGTTIVAILDGMDPEFIARLFAGFADLPGIDQADSAAMLENPLAIPGHRQG